MELSEKWDVGEVGCLTNGQKGISRFSIPTHSLVVGEVGCRRSGMFFERNQIFQKAHFSDKSRNSELSDK